MQKATTAQQQNSLTEAKRLKQLHYEYSRTFPSSVVLHIQGSAVLMLRRRVSEIKTFGARGYFGAENDVFYTNMSIMGATKKLTPLSPTLLANATEMLSHATYLHDRFLAEVDRNSLSALTKVYPSGREFRGWKREANQIERKIVAYRKLRTMALNGEMQGRELSMLVRKVIERRVKSPQDNVDSNDISAPFRKKPTKRSPLFQSFTVEEVQNEAFDSDKPDENASLLKGHYSTKFKVVSVKNSTLDIPSFDSSVSYSKITRTAARENYAFNSQTTKAYYSVFKQSNLSLSGGAKRKANGAQSNREDAERPLTTKEIMLKTVESCKYASNVQNTRTDKPKDLDTSTTTSLKKSETTVSSITQSQNFSRKPFEATSLHPGDRKQTTPLTTPHKTLQEQQPKPQNSETAIVVTEYCTKDQEDTSETTIFYDAHQDFVSTTEGTTSTTIKNSKETKSTTWDAFTRQRDNKNNNTSSSSNGGGSSKWTRRMSDSAESVESAGLIMIDTLCKEEEDEQDRQVAASALSPPTPAITVDTGSIRPRSTVMTLLKTGRPSTLSSSTTLSLLARKGYKDGSETDDNSAFLDSTSTSASTDAEQSTLFNILSYFTSA